MKTPRWLLYSACLSLLSASSLAAEVLSVKDKKVVLIFGDDEKIRLHQRFSLTHPDTGDKIGIVEIIKKKDRKALCKIIKGSAKKGAITDAISSKDEIKLDKDPGSMTEENYADMAPPDDSDKDDLYSEAMTSGSKKKKSDRTPSSDLDKNSLGDTSDGSGITSPFYEPDEPPSEGIGANPGHWGFGLGITPTTIQISDDFASNNLKGTNFVIRLSYDKPLAKMFSALLSAGTLPVAASQADSVLGTAKLDVAYYSFEAVGRVSFYGTPLQGPWLGAGVNYLRLNDASSNVIDPQSMGSHTVFQLCAGLNARMDYEYLMFRGDILFHPSSGGAGASVKITQYVLSATYFF